MAINRITGQMAKIGLVVANAKIRVLFQPGQKGAGKTVVMWGMQDADVPRAGGAALQAGCEGMHGNNHRIRATRGKSLLDVQRELRVRASYSFTPSLFLQALLQYTDVADFWSTNVRFGIMPSELPSR